jgi:hypothetical protein
VRRLKILRDFDGPRRVQPSDGLFHLYLDTMMNVKVIRASVLAPVSIQTVHPDSNDMYYG